ncbi:MAG: bifunctional anthranilate synthase component I family protein/class IV aminotransferase [Verrucomicrobia bacterium]|nr:bifunctional anthranilate synthase component I family protein/class IV aminotransferase [Verrucomicrobiota bacterium]MCH8527868.1 bifunctional anthranilate synthase component I family protein/class IV aminotransferase [Kiritimatiellia bacterium]
MLEANRPEEVESVIRKAREAQTRGLHAVGWIAYEAAAAFDASLPRRRPPEGTPYARFSVYETENPGLPRNRHPGPFTCDAWRESLTAGEFAERINRIRGAIADGETYQVNFTSPAYARFTGDPWSLFRALRAGQSARHQAYLDEGDRIILSASPELFFHLKDGHVRCRPMKGTAPPGGEQALRSSPKDRAENVMIVDMIRNDLGKCAVPGTVGVESLFAIEPYPSLVQMTSTVQAQTRAGVWDLLRALFPCASITGAPKRQTMRWIQDLEPEPRGVYTGAVGGLFADGAAEFNVAIRTAVINRAAQALRYDTGCGIVWDSDPEDEYRESRLKANIIRNPAKPFHLIETLKAVPGEGCALWPCHRERLLRSCRELGFAVRAEDLDAEFTARLETLQSPQKFRLLADMDGGLEWTASPLPPEKSNLRVALDTAATPRNHPELRHKTTRRSVYTAARERCPEADDTLLINEDGELMEFTIGNLVLERNGERLTPPLSSGLLPGTARQALLDAGELREAVLTPTDIDPSDALYLLNAVRGLVPVTFEPVS